MQRNEERRLSGQNRPALREHARLLLGPRLFAIRVSRSLGLRWPDTPASKTRARPRAAQYTAHRGPAFGLVFAWRNRRAFVWLSVLRFELGVPNPTFLAFFRQARQPAPARSSAHQPASSARRGPAGRPLEPNANNNGRARTAACRRHSAHAAITATPAQMLGLRIAKAQRGRVCV